MILALDGLAIGHGTTRVGENIDLTVSPGEVLCVLGPNGVGKTTLFRTMLGLVPPLSGRVTLDGQPLGALSESARARALAYVPQAAGLMFPFTLRDLVLMGRAPHIAPFAAPARRDEAIADAVLAQLGLAHLAARPCTEISGGERQIALIARALAQEPRILIMDEPTASLDFGNQIRVLDHIRALADTGIAVVFSTHNPDHAFASADRVALLSGGRLIAQGVPGEVVTAAALRALYGVDVVIGRVPGSATLRCAPREFLK